MESAILSELRSLAAKNIVATNSDLMTTIVQRCREAASEGKYEYSTNETIPDNVLRYLQDNQGLRISKYQGIASLGAQNETVTVINW